MWGWVMDPRLDSVEDDLVTFRVPPFADGGSGPGHEATPPYEHEPQPPYRFVSPGELPWPTEPGEAEAPAAFWHEAERDRRAARRRRPRRLPPWTRVGGDREPLPWQRPVVVAVVLVAVLGVVFALGRLSGTERGEPDAGPAARDGAVPRGFAHSMEGATAAAADYAALVATPALAATDSMSATLAAIAAPGADFADAAAAAVHALAARLAEAGVQLDDRVTYRTFPLTVRLRRYTETSAEVEVWAASVLAVDGVRPAGAAFVTYRISLAWAGADWRVSDLSVRATPTDAATPAELADFDGLQYEAVQ